MSSPRLIPVGTAELGTSPGFGHLLLAVAGGALLAARPSRPSHARTAVTLAGVALLGAAATRPFGNAVRIAGGKRRNADVRQSFMIAQPVERVFAFCRDFENFPRFIGSLREVRDYGDGRSHWCASTPAGKTVEWDAVITKYVTNSVIGWRTVGASPVRSSGLIRMKPEDGGTCLQVTVSYQVNDSRFADSLASLAAPSLEHQLERDICKLASYLERATESELAVS
jgi:uncharacterized membrane protein